MNFSSDPIHNLENLIAKNTTKSISIYLLVVITLIGVLACLPIIKVDISKQSRGIIRAKQDNSPLISIVSGKLTQVRLKNNQQVYKGDTLLIITTDNIKAQKTLNDSLLKQAEIKFIDYINLINNKPKLIKDNIIIDDYERYLFQKQELVSKVQQAKINFNRYEQLFKKQIVAQSEYETYLYGLKFAKEALNSFIKQQRAQWQSKKREIETQIRNLMSKKEQFISESNNYVLTAPISGTLENVLGLQVGSFVNASQIIATISPNSNLIVENTVSPTDIGLLKIGQDVKFQLDAFNYNQWGMLEGKVIDIDKNITIQDNSAFFKVRSSLNSKQLTLKNGYKTNISKGMTLTTHYFITRRSLYELLFDKVDDWFNPKILD
ncbi:HlyD family efflux transporter periplasmic adaptor subunit [Hyunsoonleella sp. SJ7]|uniref:HlyD family efflux transporter periplasmic adaptor subunit n=1 Tax=Hyunsoonleella aquatilis TaxID=2762758 RepID=A0A923H7H6_9FLAO|nr:HlyD family efflux transporter periplasmic adaptor subunit [Hyunsoonleella aquatilis]MBC3757345.1 HlyD family efflux transporter periplasmic adaptor subunit [Hyunsoonleella aquatilis]